MISDDDDDWAVKDNYRLNTIFLDRNVDNRLIQLL